MPTRTLNTHIGVDVVTSVNVTGVSIAIHPANTAVMIVMISIGNTNNAMICTGITARLRCLMDFNLRVINIDLLRGLAVSQ